MQTVSRFLGVFLVIVCMSFVINVDSVAQAEETTFSLAQLAGCSGVDCSACNVVGMANGLIKWLVGFLFVLFAVLIAWAGFQLVTSGGNSHALDEAKDKFSNAFIGLLIILAAWLVVDTIMRGLVGGPGGEPGQLGATWNSEGKVEGWLFWSEVQCYKPVKPTGKAWDNPDEEYVPEAFWPGDPGSAGGQFVAEYVCDPTPAGNVNCTAARKRCTDQGYQSLVNDENPTNYKVSCVQLTGGNGTGGGQVGSGSTGCSGGSCVPLTIPCSKSYSCSIASDMVSRLEKMHRTAAVSGARVTEAMPPTRTHKSPCHKNGTCVDYSKAGGMTAAEVIRVINAASSNGLRAEYEVHTTTQKDALVRAGAPASSIRVLGDWISAPHFSIYGR